MTRIEQGQHILKMIEAVDVNDTDALDEIDILAWCFFEEEKFIGWVNNERWYFDTDYLIGRAARGKPQYTRSLDALHDVMPDGWIIDTSQSIGFKSFQTMLATHSEGTIVSRKSERLPTMHLAWLHAIIQAYIYMEGNDE